MAEVLSTIFPPSSLDEVLLLLASLHEPEFVRFRDDVRASGFEANRDRCNALSPDVGLPTETVALVLNALSYVYVRLGRIKLDDPSPLIADFVAQFDGHDLETKNRLTDRLVQLVKPSREIDHARKLVRLRTGFLKNATGFASFIDVRPDYEPDNSKIRSFVPMMQFRITTDAENAAERDFVFQLDESGLAALKETVNAAEEKLKTLKESNLLAAPLHTSKWTKNA